MTGGEAQQPYGPNTRAVRRFLQRLAAEPAGTCVAAAKSYRTLLRNPAMIVADRRLGEAIESAKREPARDAVVGPLVQLIHSYGTSFEGADVITIDDAAEAALGAALALVARDLIPPESFEILYRPFADVIPAEKLDA